MASERGHLFVVEGDLTTFQADAILLSCDSRGNVTRTWSSLFARQHQTDGDAASWFKLVGKQGDGFATYPPSRSRPRLGICSVVDSVADPQEIASAVASGLQRLAYEITESSRSMPLIAMPFIGAGESGLGGRRGAVLDHLIAEIDTFVNSQAVDVALVLYDRVDHMAAQAARNARAKVHGTAKSWRLTAGLRRSAVELGGLAQRGELSLFVGAGVSRPLGLPDWPSLVEKLEEKAGVTGIPDTELIDRAQAASDAWVSGSRTPFEQTVARMTSTKRYSLGHGLLAGLRAPRVVTTNFDQAYELAAAGVFGPRGFDVMTRDLPTRGRPWVLKLHGDSNRPKTIILTRKQYDQHASEEGALRGLIQGLLLTSHVAFVGFSLFDSDFLNLATDVVKVRETASVRSRRKARVGTAIALTPGAVNIAAIGDGLRVETLRDDSRDVDAAARDLEIYLDLVLYTAMSSGSHGVEYLLDKRYDEAFTSKSDVDLRRIARNLIQAAGPTTRESPGWSVLEDALTSLGWRK